MVNLAFKLGPHARLNLQGNVVRTEKNVGQERSLRIQIPYRKDIDWMLDRKLIDAPCSVEYPDGTRKNVIFQFVANKEEGFVLEGCFVGRKKRVIMEAS